MAQGFESSRNSEVKEVKTEPAEVKKDTGSGEKVDENYDNCAKKETGEGTQDVKTETGEDDGEDYDNCAKKETGEGQREVKSEAGEDDEDDYDDCAKKNDAGGGEIKQTNPDNKLEENGPQGSENIKKTEVANEGEQPKGAEGTPEGEEPKKVEGTPEGEEPKKVEGTPEGEEPKKAEGTPEGEEPKKVEGTPEGEEPKKAEGTPEGEEPKGAEGTPEGEESKKAEGTPEGEEPKKVEGTPEGEEPKKVEGTPEGEEPKKAEGTPEGEDTKKAEGTPEGEDTKKVEGTPEGEEPKKVEGTPEGEEPKKVEGTPEGEEPKKVEGTPEGEEPKSAEGTPEGEEPKKAEGTPEGEEPKKAEGTPEGEEPKKAEGTPEGEEPKKAEGTPEGEEPKKAEGTPEGEEPKKAEGTPEGEQPKDAEGDSESDQPKKNEEDPEKLEKDQNPQEAAEDRANAEKLGMSQEEYKSFKKNNREISERTQEQPNLDDRIHDAMENEKTTASELGRLRDESADRLQELKERQAEAHRETSEKFNAAASQSRGTAEFKQALQDYNESQQRQLAMDDQVRDAEAKHNALSEQVTRLRNEQIGQGQEARAESVGTLDRAKDLQAQYDQNIDARRPDREALKQIRDGNNEAISQLNQEKDALKLAMDAKMDQIRDYVYANNMSRYDTSRDMRYQQMMSQYREFADAYSQADYNSVKLAENNKSIDERLDAGKPKSVEVPGERFGPYEVDSHGFVKGENHDQFIKNWEGYSADRYKTEMFDQPNIQKIDPSLVEGIRVSEYDVKNPDVFWSQHESGGTAESFKEIADNIPAVQARLDKGESLSDLMQDPKLGQCAAIYFHPDNIPQVIKCGDYYEFQENGRHRILAAREAGYDIPVKVIGERTIEAPIQPDAEPAAAEQGKKTLGEKVRGLFDRFFEKEKPESNGAANDYERSSESLNLNPEANEQTEDTREEESIKALRDKITAFLNKEAGAEGLNEVNPDVVSAQKMIDGYCNNDLKGILSDTKKAVRLKDTVEFQDDAAFAKGLGSAKEAASCNGYNDGIKSYVKDSGPHPKKTAIHEHNHQLSCNDVKDESGKVIEYRRGVSINGKDRQVNEALTELFTKRMMGADYPANPNVGYKYNMLRMEKMESGFGKDLLKEAYYQNKPELIKSKYESVMGKGTWESFSKSFDDSLCDYSDQEILAKREHYRKFGTVLQTATDIKRKKATDYANKCATLFAIKSKGMKQNGK